MPRRNKKNKGKKKASIASSLVESMKNGTLGNDDLFASMQSKDQGPSEELLHVAEADVNNLAVSEVAKTKDATSRSGNTFEEKKPVFETIRTPQGKLDERNGFTETDAEKQEQNHNNSNQKKNTADPIQDGQIETAEELIDDSTGRPRQPERQSDIRLLHSAAATPILFADKDHIKERIRKKLVQRSKLSNDEVSFKLHHKIGELVENPAMIALEVQKHLQSENEQRLYSFIIDNDHELSNELLREYTNRYSAGHRESKGADTDGNNCNAEEVMAQSVKLDEHYNIRNILRKKNAQSLYRSTKKMREAESKLKFQQSAEEQIRKAQLARFLARRVVKLHEK